METNNNKMKQLRVLIVEDEPHAQNELKRLLANSERLTCCKHLQLSASLDPCLQLTIEPDNT